VAGYGGIGLPSSSNATQEGYAGGLSDGFLVVLSQPEAATSSLQSRRGRGDGTIVLPRDPRR
jgi:hypothetical protein